ncbi:MAG TPA: glycan-binding surface protein [Prolixibacteraceae bacterium]
MKNRNIFKSAVALIFVLLMLITGVVFNSCKKDNVGGTMPVITNFRVVEKDSLITAGAFGLTIAVIGENLQDVKEVWFNDQKSALNPNFVTSSNIICAIPNKLPSQITNKIKLVTKAGLEYTADFKVILPKPVINSLYNEMAEPGSITKVIGSSLYFISEVKFGDLPATILESKDTEISVTVPAGAVACSLVTVTGEGGTVVSTFKYKDAGLWLFDFDKAATSWGSIDCWGGMKMRSDAESINGAYGYIEGTDLPPSSWNNDWVASTCWFDYGYNNVDFSMKVLKFEVKAKEPWVWSDAISSADQAGLLITINGSKTYTFMPQEILAYRTTGFTTNGWMTVSIPMSSFGIGVASINDFQLVFKTNKQVYSKFATYIDNFRICTPVVSAP